MKVDTYLYGAVEVNPESVITFPNGLVAFEDKKRFLLVHEEVDGGGVSFTLQSLEDPGLAFLIEDPSAFGFIYELALTDAENALLQYPTPDDVSVVLILYKQEEGGAKTINPNLRAPLIINTKARVGLQKVMEKVRQNVVLSNLVNPV